MASQLEKTIDNAVEKTIANIMKAVTAYQNNPEKAQEYILRKVRAIYTAGKQLGRDSALHDIFNGDSE